MPESEKKVKVLFHTLFKRKYRRKMEDLPEDTPLNYLDDCMKMHLRQPKKDRFFDLQGNKFCFIESAAINTETSGTTITGVFKSARSEFRPNLINKRTGNERSNPKEISEGDIEKTHFLIRMDEEETFLLLERNYNGVRANNVVNYIKRISKVYHERKRQPRNYTIKHTTVARNNFLTEMERLSRTQLAEIYFDKRLLGSDALNFSNRFSSVKQYIKLQVGARTREDITEMGIDFFNRFNGVMNRDKSVSKVRIHGKDENNNDVLLDTDLLGVVEYFNVDVNPSTGELNSTQVFNGLKNLSSQF